jgi:hypothetical protein
MSKYKHLLGGDILQNCAMKSAIEKEYFGHHSPLKIYASTVSAVQIYTI